MNDDIEWKIQIADAVLDIRARGEALSLVALLSNLRERSKVPSPHEGDQEKAIEYLLLEPDMGEVGDLSDAF